MSLRDFPGPGHEVKVSEGPRRGQAGVVVRVLRYPKQPASAAVVLVRFQDWSEEYQVGANLEIVQAAKKGGER